MKGRIQLKESKKKRIDAQVEHLKAVHEHANLLQIGIFFSAKKLGFLLKEGTLQRSLNEGKSYL